MAENAYVGVLSELAAVTAASSLVTDLEFGEARIAVGDVDARELLDIDSELVDERHPL